MERSKQYKRGKNKNKLWTVRGVWISFLSQLIVSLEELDGGGEVSGGGTHYM